ncbi:hypothetical protein Bra60_011790 [Bartonella sp. Raccoon60]|nr:hypothetical protein Bra60_011790 [Bartonella sp. Raccoon60]
MLGVCSSVVLFCWSCVLRDAGCVQFCGVVLLELCVAQCWVYTVLRCCFVGAVCCAMLGVYSSAVLFCWSCVLRNAGCVQFCGVVLLELCVAQCWVCAVLLCCFVGAMCCAMLDLKGFQRETRAGKRENIENANDY